MSSGNGVASRHAVRGFEYDVDGIDFPRPSYAPAVWLCLGAPGGAAQRSLSRWLVPADELDAASAVRVGLAADPDERQGSQSLALLRRITRVVRPSTVPLGDLRSDATYAEIHAAMRDIMRAPEIRGGQRDDVIAPNLWVVCDLSRNVDDGFFDWLDAAVGALRKDDIVCRTTVIARFARGGEGMAAQRLVKERVARLVDRVTNLGSNLSSAFRVLVVADRDRQGSLFAPEDLAAAIGHFAEFILLAKAPGATASGVIPLFTSPEMHLAARDPWEHLPIFGSFWLTRVQVKGSDARLRINPELRTRVAASIAADASPFWVPRTPAFGRVDLIRDVRWASLELPTWRTVQWEEAPEETQRFATELDRWVAAAAHWRRTMLATYVELGENIRRQAARSVRRYWDDVDQLGALALDDPELPGGIDLLEHLVDRCILEVDAELSAFPDAGPKTRRLPTIRPDQVDELIPTPQQPLGNALYVLSRRIACRVHPLQLILLTALATFMAWRWTVISIRDWDASGFGWIGRQDLPFEARDPILVAITRRAQDVRRWLEPTPVSSISTLQWVLIGIVAGAIAFVVAVLLLDRWGVSRSVNTLRKRAQAWIDEAHHELPVLLAHRETVINKREIERIRRELHACKVTLGQLRVIARDHGVVPLPPDTAFSTNVRLASPAFARVTEDDVESVTMGIRHAMAPGWRRITERDFVQTVLDQEEPVTARGGRAVHDPRAEIEPLIAMLKSRMPVDANILIPPMANEPIDLPSTTFSRIVSVPAHSGELVRAALSAEEFADITFISHEPERVAFLIGLEMDASAKDIFGEQTRPDATRGQSAPSGGPPPGGDDRASGPDASAWSSGESGADPEEAADDAPPEPADDRQEFYDRGMHDDKFEPDEPEPDDLPTAEDNPDEVPAQTSHEPSVSEVEPMDDGEADVDTADDPYPESHPHEDATDRDPSDDAGDAAEPEHDGAVGNPTGDVSRDDDRDADTNLGHLDAGGYDEQRDAS